MNRTAPPATDSTSAPPTALGHARERWMLIVLGFCMMVSPAAIDMYLPALSTVAQELSATGAQVQLSVSYFFLGFGLGQLFWGPLSDRFGRRLPLLAGIVLFIVASLVAGMVQTIDQMLIARFVQAVGGCAMPVIAQSMARDAWGKQRSAQALSVMLLMMSIAPLIAPLIGAQILRLAQWRAVFGAIAAFGVIGLLLALSLPETRPRALRANAPSRPIISDYLRLLGDPRYLGYALASAAIWGALFVYVAGVPLIYLRHFGLSPQTFSLLFAANIAGLVVINIVNTRLLRQHTPPDRLLRIGIIGCAIVTLALALLACLGALPLPAMAALLFVFVGLRGFINANAMAGALANHAERAGAAVALAGALQFATGFAAGALMSAFSDGSPRPMLLVMAALGLIALVLMLTLLRHRREVIETEI